MLLRRCRHLVRATDHHPPLLLPTTTYSTKCRSERKPLVVPITELKRRARASRAALRVAAVSAAELPLRPPENGLLVPHLVPLARAVLSSRRRLLRLASAVLAVIPAHACLLCGQLHVGHPPHLIRSCPGAGGAGAGKRASAAAGASGMLPNVESFGRGGETIPKMESFGGGGIRGGGEHIWGPAGVDQILPKVESFHLYDRIGRAVSHEERLQVDRIPAVVELCVQAGVDLPEYPTRRRKFPVYNVAGKVIDFEKRFPRSYESGADVETFGFWRRKKRAFEADEEEKEEMLATNGSVQELARLGMEAWEEMRSGIQKLMEKYPVQTCGYCPEVQVGPKGHRARICQAYKHQMRAGQHAWQQATIDDLVPPVYVWHVPDPQHGEPLLHELRAYYSKLPAVVELFAQAGADVGEEYCSMMRDDVVVPGLDEEKLAV